jgi:hypothetical protein
MYATGFDVPQLPGFARSQPPSRRAGPALHGVLAREEAASQWGQLPPPPPRGAQQISQSARGQLETQPHSSSWRPPPSPPQPQEQQPPLRSSQGAQPPPGAVATGHHLAGALGGVATGGGRGRSGGDGAAAGAKAAAGSAAAKRNAGSWFVAAATGSGDVGAKSHYPTDRAEAQARQAAAAAAAVLQQQGPPRAAGARPAASFGGPGQGGVQPDWRVAANDALRFR